MTNRSDESGDVPTSDELNYSVQNQQVSYDDEDRSYILNSDLLLQQSKKPMEMPKASLVASSSTRANANNVPVSKCKNNLPPLKPCSTAKKTVRRRRLYDPDSFEDGTLFD